MIWNRHLKNIALICVIGLLGACASSGLVTDGSNAASGSLFSKLELGMGRFQAQKVVGDPDDSKRYPTAKRWLPYYYGVDTVREELFYKGEGRLIFGGNQRLIKIIVDPDEDKKRLQ